MNHIHPHNNQEGTLAHGSETFFNLWFLEKHI